MKMTPEKMKMAQGMKDEGATYREIGAVIGMAGSSVRYNLDKDAREAILERNAGCREEKAAYDLEYNAANKEGRADYVEKNKERILIRDAKYRSEHLEEKSVYNAKYTRENKDRLAPYYAAYRGEHREENVAYGKEYRENNKEKISEYIKANLPKYSERSAARRALKAGWLLGATAAQKAEIDEIYRKAKEDANIRCYLCGDWVPLGERHVDHVRALTNGGAHLACNMAVSCASCNLSKGGKTLEEVGLLL